MKRKQIRLIGYCMAIVLIVALELIMPACSSTSTFTQIPITTTTTLIMVSVEPAYPADLAVGSTQQFTATGTYSDGSTMDITNQVTWASSATTMATISSAGLATGVAAGNTNITASMSGVISPAVMLTVIAPTPTSTSGS